MNILVACEESQAVTIELRKLGHNAFSCDLVECSGYHPEWHIKSDVLPLLNGFCTFATCDGCLHFINSKWDMILAFPPCTYLTVTGNRWFNIKKYGNKALERIKNREKAINFFMNFVNADCDKICIENPIGVMSSFYRKPDQIIHPYFFGDAQRKATCLWLKGLPLLKSTKIVTPEIIKYKNGRGTDSPWHIYTMSLPPLERAKMRSKTFPGLASAMALQFTNLEV